MTIYTIDKNVPVSATSIYPFEQMSVGDSFFAPGKTIQNLLTSAQRMRAAGHKYTARTRVENGVEGARIWRIA